MTMAMVGTLSPSMASNAYLARALERLAAAVLEEARERGACRDSSAAAATRVRPWTVSLGEA